MKKNFLTCMLCIATMWAMANNGEGSCGIYMLVNGESQNYRLTSTDWGENSLTEPVNHRPELKDAEISIVASLTLCGGIMVAWAEGNDYYETNSFRVQYRVYKQGETAPDEWEEMALDEQTWREGNDYRYEAKDKTIDLLALTDSTAGTWVFEAKMLGHKYWDNHSGGSGSWDTNHDPQSTTFVLEKNIPTSIDHINFQNNGKYYDILGREVSHPQPGNLYIHNGKKILF